MCLEMSFAFRHNLYVCVIMQIHRWSPHEKAYVWDVITIPSFPIVNQLLQVTRRQKEQAQSLRLPKGKISKETQNLNGIVPCLERFSFFASSTIVHSFIIGTYINSYHKRKMVSRGTAQSQ